MRFKGFWITFRRTYFRILEYLKSIQGKSADKVKLSKNLGDILAEDKKLLERLAK